MATKLHELLAVENNLEGQAGKTRSELMKTFADKRHLFQETLQTFKSSEEGSTPVVEQQSSIQTTIVDELTWVGKILAKAWDAGHQIDVANTLAKADVVDEESGAIILKAVPATSLLQLEKRLKELHELIVTVPTLDPAKGFKPDPDKGKHAYKALDVVKARTKKNFKFIVMVPATKEHPAQIEKMNVDEPVGDIHQQEWSSLITPAMKADLLSKCDGLMRAVKRARSKANEQEVDVKGERVAQTLIDYVFGPLKA